MNLPIERVDTSGYAQSIFPTDQPISRQQKRELVRQAAKQYVSQRAPKFFTREDRKTFRKALAVKFNADRKKEFSNGRTPDHAVAAAQA